MQKPVTQRLNIGVIGTGISGLSAAWLLAQRHNVTVFEKASRLGGHSNTVFVEGPDGPTPIDTGFIVYNTVNYPNLIALFRSLDVPTKPSDMSFSVSLGGGAFEYAGNTVASLFAQKENLLRPRFWSMISGLLRFYRNAPADRTLIDDVDITLGDYLSREGYSAAFQRDHLFPMAGAIWSAPPETMLDYPARAFVEFFKNHGLLQLRNRPPWRTVVGGSCVYVAKLAKSFAEHVRAGRAVTSVKRDGDGVTVRDDSGETSRFDHVVIAAHADQALAMLADPTADETALLGAIRYSRNIAVLHSDSQLMPRRRSAWSSWNYLAESDIDAGDKLCVTYWMNSLQGIDQRRNYFVTINPMQPPKDEDVLHTDIYEHPIYDAGAIRAQAAFSRLQGVRRTWYCGAYFGFGFHEDGLDSGLATAEALGGMDRPWAAAVPSETEALP